MATLTHYGCQFLFVLSWFSLRSVGLLFRANEKSVSAKYVSVLTGRKSGDELFAKLCFCVQLTGAMFPMLLHSGGSM